MGVSGAVRVTGPERYRALERGNDARPTSFPTSPPLAERESLVANAELAPTAHDGRGPGVRRGLFVLRCTSAGRDVLAEAERLQDAVEVELRQAA